MLRHVAEIITCLILVFRLPKVLSNFAAVSFGSGFSQMAKWPTNKFNHGLLLTVGLLSTMVKPKSTGLKASAATSVTKNNKQYKMDDANKVFFDERSRHLAYVNGS